MSEVTTEAKIFSCTQSKALATKIAAAYGTKLGNVITSTYSDGEFQPSFEESVRGSRVFIIGSTHPGSDNAGRCKKSISQAYYCRATVFRLGAPG